MSNAPIEDIYPLTPMQQGMLFHTLYAPHSGVYVEQLSCTITGELNIASFERAWQRVVERHPALRTAFIWEELTEPVQVVCQTARLPLVQPDWRDFPPGEQQERLAAFLADDRRRGFELATPPLMRLALIRLAEGRRQFVWSFQHLLLDGWSSTLLLKEVFAFYEAFSRGEDLYLERPRPFRDYVAWLGEQDQCRAEAFWRAALKGFTAPTPLTVGSPPSELSDETDDYWEEELKLPAELTAALQVLARQHRLTLNTLMQGVWALLLSRYSGSNDVVFGTVVSGRPASLAGVEQMTGLFVNTLPARVRVRDEEPALAWLRRLQSEQSELRAYEYSPLVEVQGWSEVERGRPLFESLFVFENYPVDASLRQQVDALRVSDVRSIEKANYPLTLLVVPGEGLLLRIIYNCRRFDTDTIKRMLGHCRMLLSGIAAAPHQTVSALPLLTALEREQMLIEWNDTSASRPEDLCAQQLFEAQVERTPDRVAVVCGDERLSYGELNQRANRVARRLQQLGVGPERTVAVMFERSVEMVVALLGVLKAGGAYVPLDPSYPRERLAFVLADSGAQALLTERRLIEQLPDTDLKILCLDADWTDIAQEKTENAVARTTPENLAYVIYTSGSTGRPKGVLITHRNLVASTTARSAYYREPVANFLLLSPLVFDSSVAGIFWTLCQGGALVIPEEGQQREVPHIVALIAQHRISHLLCVPSFYSLLLAQETATELSSLRTIIVAGEVCPPQLVERHDERLPCTILFNEYGPTEATVWSSVHRCLPREQRAPLPIGRPIANIQIYLLDAHLNPVPIGASGELYLGGVGLARGYLNRPDLTAEKFIPNPFTSQAGARLYRTGDLARFLPSGEIEFLGRADEQVKVRGYRIELGEIEAALSHHPQVRECAVIARTDKARGTQLIAYVVVQHGAEASVEEWRRFLREKLPEHMIPAWFVKLEELPRTVSGKVERRALPEPDRGRAEMEKGYVGPRSGEEEALAAVWSEVLGVERVGIHDNFFDLGGHSLLATQLLSRVREIFAVELPMRSLFETPTVARLIERIQSARREKQGLPPLPLQPVPRDAELPLSFAQERMWFGHQFEPVNSGYNTGLAVRVHGALDTAALEQSLNMVVRRHEALRTTFISIYGRPLQVIAPALELPLTLVDLSQLPQDGREAEARRIIVEESEQPFELTNGPLLRATLLRLGEQEHILLLTVHHIAFDGWSVGVFAGEVKAFYEAFSAGRSPSLPVLSLQYADFAFWQRQWLQGDFLAAQLDYWEKQLKDARGVLKLPADRPRTATISAPGAVRKFVLPATLTAALRELCRREGVTLFMLLLATFKTLLHRYTGETDITVGTPVANRNRVETEALIGCFINPLALRTDLSGDPPFGELLSRIREVALGAYAHQDLPFEHLVKALRLERDPTRNPLFQVMFILQNAPLPDLRLPGLILQPMDGDSHESTFDMCLTMFEGGEETTGFLEYRTDLFDAATITRLIGHYQTLLAGIVAAPGQPLSALPLLTADEQRQLLGEWSNAGGGDHRPPPLSVQQLFEAQVERTPDRIAIVSSDAGDSLTYQELNSRANQLAHYLRRLGVGPETLVGILLERSPETVVAVLGVLKAGGAYVPLDVSSPKERLASVLADSRARVLLTQQRLIERLPTDKPHVVCLDTDWAAIAVEVEENPTGETTPDNLAYVIYTSGSTGRPKGVLIRHGSLASYVEASIAMYELEPSDRVLQFASLSFDTSAEEIYPCLASGATLILRSEAMLDPPVLLRECAEREITVIDLPTAYWHELAASLDGEHSMLPPSLRLVIIGGERALPERLALWQQRASAGVRLVNTYGPTEATIVATVCDLQGLAAEHSALREAPIGRAIRGARTYILDRHLRPVPVGVPGELYLGGVGLARGYLFRPDLTAEKFIPNPFSTEPGARLYRTGDLARFLPSGEIEFLGRTDEQVKVRGYRIELGEIEAALSQHRQVCECAVATDRDDSGQARLVAYVVAREEVLSSGALRDYLRDKLPAYMIPALFVELDELPRTPSGKVDRQGLPGPDKSRVESANVYIAPRTETERVVAGIWADALGVERVGMHDNFFDLGGHSLLAIQLVARLREALQVELPIRWLFEVTTVAELSEKIELSRRAGWTGIVQTAPEIDLNAEVVLDPAISPTASAEPETEAQAVLLTGSTGFLGAFLLHDLLRQTRADIYCLVRARDRTEAQRKLRETLELYQLWDERLDGRIIPVAGDLAQPLLGLSAERFQELAATLDHIYHAGALVNATYPYAALKAANVLGTQEVLRLACQGRTKPVHFVSTLSVFPANGSNESGLIREDDELTDGSGLEGGYAQSKWVAEKLVAIARSRGLPVSIYRPGRISGHSRTGAWKTSDLVCALINVCVQLGSVPEIDLLVDLIPVDYVSRAIVYLSKRGESHGKAFNIMNPYPMRWAELVDWLRSVGYPLRQVSYERWRAELLRLAASPAGDKLAPLLLLLPASAPAGEHTPAQTLEEELMSIQIECRNTLMGLAGTNITCPPVDATLLSAYSSYLSRSGFLHSPAVSTEIEERSFISQSGSLYD